MMRMMMSKGYEPSWDNFESNIAATSMASYEDTVVRRLCKAIGRPRLPAELVASNEKGKCTFSAFDMATNFPMRFSCGKLRRIRFVTIPDLFNKFSKTPIGYSFSNLIQDFDIEDKPIGLVFRWVGTKTEDGKQHTIKGGRYMVAHNGPSTISRNKVAIYADMNGMLVIVQLLDDLIDFYVQSEDYSFN